LGANVGNGCKQCSGPQRANKAIPTATTTTATSAAQSRPFICFSLSALPSSSADGSQIRDSGGLFATRSWEEAAAPLGHNGIAILVKNVGASSACRGDWSDLNQTSTLPQLSALCMSLGLQQQDEGNYGPDF